MRVAWKSSLVLLMALAFTLGRALRADSLALPHYQLGDIATADIRTPVPLVVADPERTEALRQEQARRIPPIFCFNPDGAAETDARLRDAFNRAHDRFSDAVEAVFKQRILSAQDCDSPPFFKALASFQKQHPTFPLTTNLAVIWAQGQSDETILAELSHRLGQFATTYLRPDATPAEGKVSSGQVRVLVLRASDPAPELETVEKESLPYIRTNISHLSAARTELRNSFSSNELATAKFLATFLKENCVFDAELTRQIRTKQTATFIATDRYELDQVIVKSGQRIDARIKAALDQLREAAKDQIKSQTALAQLKEEVALVEVRSQHATRQNLWLLAGLVLVAVTSSAALWQMARLKRSQVLLPARWGDAAADAGDFSAEAGWKERALAAEQRAAQATAVLRAGLLPHLARWLRDRWMRTLARQRTQLLTTQQKAELELAELEKRLAQVHAPMEDRLLAYEKRIVELEKELMVKGEENRELIKAQIVLARGKIEQAKSGNRLTWN
jgi:membrane-associated HD superfamily phosphohydrolase